MGLKKNQCPDFCNRSNENFIHTDAGSVMPILSSSDSEEDDVSSGRYTALPQDLPDNSNQQDDNESKESSEDEDEDEDEPNVELSEFDQATKFEVTQLWNSENNRLTDIVMDSTKVEQIKTAMAGFKLPSSAIPSWAENIPEEEWKQQIIDKVNLFKKYS